MFKTNLLNTVAIVVMLVFACLVATPVMAADTEKPTGGSVALTNSMVTPFATVQVGGGTWDYGTRIVGLGTKQVWSNYWHPTAVHRSSCRIGTNYNNSGWVPAKYTSYSSAVGSWFNTGYAYWDKI